MIRYEPWVQHNLIREEGRLPALRELAQSAPVEKTAALSAELRRPAPSPARRFSRPEAPSAAPLRRSPGGAAGAGLARRRSARERRECAERQDQDDRQHQVRRDRRHDGLRQQQAAELDIDVDREHTAAFRQVGWICAPTAFGLTDFSFRREFFRCRRMQLRCVPFDFAHSFIC